MIEGYKVTFTKLLEKGFFTRVNVTDEVASDFLRNYELFMWSDYPVERQVTIDQLKREIREGEEIDSEIREMFGLPSDCPIYVFNDGDHCSLIKRDGVWCNERF